MNRRAGTMLGIPATHKFTLMVTARATRGNDGRVVGFATSDYGNPALNLLALYRHIYVHGSLKYQSWLDCRIATSSNLSPYSYLRVFDSWQEYCMHVDLLAGCSLRAHLSEVILCFLLSSDASLGPLVTDYIFYSAMSK